MGLLRVSVVVFLLLAVMGSAFAQQQGLKGTEGPTEIRKQEQKSPEGTEVRKKVKKKATSEGQRPRGTEGPTEIRKQEQKSPEGTEVRKKVKKKKTTGAEGQKPKGFEGGDVQKKTQ